MAVKHKRKQMGEVSGASQSLHETNGHGQETPDRSYGEEGITPEAQEVLNEYTPPSSQRAAPSLSGSEMTLGQLAEALTPKSEPAPAREPAPAPVRKPRSKASLAGAVLRGMKGR